MENLVTWSDEIKFEGKAAFGDAEAIDEGAADVDEAAGEPGHTVLGGEVEAVVNPLINLNKYKRQSSR